MVVKEEQMASLRTAIEGQTDATEIKTTLLNQSIDDWDLEDVRRLFHEPLSAGLGYGLMIAVAGGNHQLRDLIDLERLAYYSIPCWRQVVQQDVVSCWAQWAIQDFLSSDERLHIFQLIAAQAQSDNELRIIASLVIPQIYRDGDLGVVRQMAAQDKRMARAILLHEQD